MQVVRGMAACACALICFMAAAGAADLEADLSTHYIEIRATFQGAHITVFGAITGETNDQYQVELPTDVVVVVRGPPEMIAVRRKDELGPIWVNRTSFTAENVPSFYYLASTRPPSAIVDESALKRYRIGVDRLGVGFERGVIQASEDANAQNTQDAPVPEAVWLDDGLTVDEKGNVALIPLPGPFAVPAMPGIEENQAFQDALFRLLAKRNAISEGTLTFVRPHLFRAEVNIPSTVPTGAYGAEVYLVRGREVVDAEFTVFFIDKKGLEGKVYGLARDNPMLNGLLGVLIAVAAGWISEFAFRKR